MTPKTVGSINQFAEHKPDWLWTWKGICFGYREADSLFTHDGVEVGRFFGVEVYGCDGRYLGEIGQAEDGARLMASVYKKSRTRPTFVPTVKNERKRLKGRAPEELFMGHEEFPSPEVIKQRRTALVAS